MVSDFILDPIDTLMNKSCVLNRFHGENLVYIHSVLFCFVYCVRKTEDTHSGVFEIIINFSGILFM